MDQPDFNITHYMPTPGNPVYIKHQRLEAGWFVDTHQHNYDHYGLLGQGEASVEVDGKVSYYVGPDVITIEAGKSHKITAITPIIWFCIHASEETDFSKIDETLIKKGGA